MAKYIIDPAKYDYDDIFTEEEREARFQLLEDKHIIHYRTKTIKSGNVLECEIYPVYNSPRSTERARKRNTSRAAQKRLNYKNALKNVIRLVNTNFTDEDIWGTFTYETARLPQTVESAEKTFANFLRRLKYHAKRKGFPPLKYVYWTEFEDDEKKGKKRVHHHIVTNFPDRDLAEKLWRGGARKQTRRLQADENGYEGMVRYCMKDPRGTKRFKTSKNLKKPQITVADFKFTRRRVNRLVRGDSDPRGVFEQMYKGYQMTTFTHKTSDYVSGAFLYIKMAKLKSAGGKVRREIHRE